MSTIKAIESFADAACKLTWGSPSIKTWERACANSQARAERKRQERRRRVVPLWERAVCTFVLIGGLAALGWLVAIAIIMLGTRL